MEGGDRLLADEVVAEAAVLDPSALGETVCFQPDPAEVERQGVAPVLVVNHRPYMHVGQVEIIVHARDRPRGNAPDTHALEQPPGGDEFEHAGQSRIGLHIDLERPVDDRAGSRSTWEHCRAGVLEVEREVAEFEPARGPRPRRAAVEPVDEHVVGHVRRARHGRTLGTGARHRHLAPGDAVEAERARRGGAPLVEGLDLDPGVVETDGQASPGIVLDLLDEHLPEIELVGLPDGRPPDQRRTADMSALRRERQQLRQTRVARQRQRQRRVRRPAAWGPIQQVEIEPRDLEQA